MMEKRDYAADLAVCEADYTPVEPEKWEKTKSKFMSLASEAMPWYIKRCMELEAVIAESQAREVALREALESIHWEATQDENYPILSITGKVLSTPSPAADRIKALEAVVEAAKGLYQELRGLAFTRSHEIDKMRNLKNALAALEKAGGENA